MRLNGKKAFITAAGQGIGKAICEKFVSENSEVYATDLNEELLKSLSADKVIVLDVTHKELLQEEIVKFNPDILVNCAGFVHAGSILDASDEQFDFAISLNVKSMFHAIQAVTPLMLEKKTGSIINIASVVSSIIGAPNRFIYGLSKAAIIGLTKSVAVEFVGQGIRCNCICPGTVDTPSLHQRLKDTGDYEKAMTDFVARQPMGRIGEPGEIASLAVYLASDESNFTTGQTHIIDGGWSVG
ncbi:MAG: NAD(P)-dependent oxidoreductase [Rhodobacteraceae bacterium]|nr:MAG: NAD(P)-dependent oxidoreductase [Paracoccaceae bacterium]